MHFNSEIYQEHTLVVQLPERFLADSVDAFKSTVSAANSAGHRHVILDFSTTQMIDSSALGAIVSVFKQLSATQGQLVLCHVNNSVMALFELTQLQKIFTIKPDMIAARARIDQIT